MQTFSAEIVDLASYREGRRHRAAAPTASVPSIAPPFFAPMFVPVMWVPVWICIPSDMAGHSHQA